MKIAVFFPGIGYHCDKPLLYYARKLHRNVDMKKLFCSIIAMKVEISGGMKKKCNRHLNVCMSRLRES